jgi:hypothetical protein
MRVLYIEGVAIRGGPESCVGDREGVGEALTGGVQAGLLSREITLVRGADAVHLSGRRDRRRRYREPLADPVRSEILGMYAGPHAREPGDLRTARQWRLVGPAAGRGGNAEAVIP